MSRPTGPRPEGPRPPRPVLPAAHVARWKKLRDPEPDAGGDWERRRFRAICGKPSCPASLGELWNTSATARDPNDVVEETADGLEEMASAIDALIEESPDGKVRAELVELRRSVAKEHERVVGDQFWGEIAIPSAIHAVKGPRWVMSPERPDHEPETPRARAPMSTYHGYPDSGYRISHGGKRNKEGWRIGRRPFKGSTFEGLSNPWDAGTQDPTPPCRIFCRVCGSLNQVDLPDELRG